MSEKVLISLFIVLAIVIVVLVLRKRIARFRFSASNEGLEAELDAASREASGGSEEGTVAGTSAPSVLISGNKLVGKMSEACSEALFGGAGHHCPRQDAF